MKNFTKHIFLLAKHAKYICGIYRIHGVVVVCLGPRLEWDTCIKLQISAAAKTGAVLKRKSNFPLANIQQQRPMEQKKMLQTVRLVHWKRWIKINPSHRSNQKRFRRRLPTTANQQPHAARNDDQGICVFDYARDRNKGVRYREKELPFVVRNNPDVHVVQQAHYWKKSTECCPYIFK